MRNPIRFSGLLLAAAPLCLALALSGTAFAAGGTGNAAAPPKPDTQTKIWTNDDVERLNPAFDASRPKQAVAAAAVAVSAASVRSAAPAPLLVVPLAPLDPQKDPAWYAQQLNALESELAGIESREDELRQFRSTSSGLPTGLVLSAPCEGITMDNLISQLDARRQEILQQLDALGDTARQNDLPPGILVEGRGRAEVAGQSAEQSADLVQRVRDASDELAQVQGTVAGMQEELSARGTSLLRPVPGRGGNMTTDLLDRLDGRASALQGEISEAEDAARGLGVPASELR